MEFMYPWLNIIRLVPVERNNKNKKYWAVSMKFTKDLVIILLKISFTVEFAIYFYKINL